MKPLLRHWDTVSRVFKHPEKALWLFDFDGTLVPIARHPEQVMMPGKTRFLFKKLSHRYPGRVGILSGRSLTKLRKKVGIKTLIYGGDHGYEIQSPRFQWQYPLSKSQQFRHRRLTVWIQREIPRIPHLWLENKHWTLCVHYREVSSRQMPQTRTFLRNLCNHARALGFIMQQGRKTLEIFTDADWNKGQAVCWLKKRLRPKGIFYVGDDTTDETVFRAMGSYGMTVHVGRPGHSRASYYIAQTAVPTSLLKRILAL